MIPLGVLASARQSGFTPAAYGNLALWLRADALSLSDGAAVSSWPDSSAAGNTATQGTAGYQPIYKTGIINGKPVVRFDNADDRMASACSLSGPELTMIAVLKRAGTAEGNLVCPNATGLGGFRLSLDSTAHVVDQGVAVMGNGSTALGTSAFRILTAKFSDSGNSWSLRINGAADASGSYAATLATGKTMMIGYDVRNNGGPINADIAELIYYTANRSLSEIQAVEAYLSAKYAI